MSSKRVGLNVFRKPAFGRKVRALVYNRSKVHPHFDRQA